MVELHAASGPDAPVRGPMAWRGEELAATGGWDHRVSDDDVLELEDAVARIWSRALAITDIARDDFTLPGLGPVLARIRGNVVDGRGVSMLRGLPVGRWSREESAIAYWGIGTHIGQAVSQNPLGHVLGHVKDLGADANEVNSRGYRSHDALPFHSDIGAEIVVLLCLNPSKSGGLSSIASGAAIHNEMLKRRPDLVAELARPWHYDRRGEVLDGMKPYYTMPVFNYLDDRLYISFVRRFIDSAQRFTELPRLTARQHEALNMMSGLAASAGMRLDIVFEPGDIQFVNNLTTLHSRTEYEDFDDPAQMRHLLRLWLANPDGRPLPAGYYERYGAGPSSTRPMGVNPQDGVLSAPLEAA